MKKALILDGTTKSNNLERKLKTLDFECHRIGDGENMTSPQESMVEGINTYGFELSICHIRWATGTDINYDMRNAAWYKKIKNIPVKIGLSDGTDYQDKFRFFFDHVDFFDNFIQAIKGIQPAEELFEEVKKRSLDYQIKKISNIILHLFLPLDVDMQALEILWDEGKSDKAKKQKAVDYLKEMLTDTTDTDDKFYQKKFTKARTLINEMPDGDLKNKIQDKHLLGSEEKKDGAVLHNFLVQLDKLREKTKGADLCEEDVKNLLEYFNKQDYKSFHDWYCALAKCLRGKENG